MAILSSLGVHESAGLFAEDRGAGGWGADAIATRTVLNTFSTIAQMIAPEAGVISARQSLGRQQGSMHASKAASESQESRSQVGRRPFPLHSGLNARQQSLHGSAVSLHCRPLCFYLAAAPWMRYRTIEPPLAARCSCVYSRGPEHLINLQTRVPIAIQLADTRGSGSPR